MGLNKDFHKESTGLGESFPWKVRDFLIRADSFPGAISILNYKRPSTTSDQYRDDYMIAQEMGNICFDGYICIESILLYFCLSGVCSKCIYVER
jgi:hypothetical protein